MAESHRDTSSLKAGCVSQVHSLPLLKALALILHRGSCPKKPLAHRRLKALTSQSGEVK